MDVEKIRMRLRGQREALLGLMKAEGGESVPEPDPTRAGRLTRFDELRNQAMSSEAVRRRKRELLRIDDALRRLDAGEYGECLVCGGGIAQGRLEADPAAERCIRCATLAEQQEGRR